MKATIHTLIAIVTAAALRADPIPITLPNAVTVEKVVSSIQSVEVTSVDVTRITIDTEAKLITFQTTTGNSTVILDGDAYEAISTEFRQQFATTIAPLIEAKIKKSSGLKQSDK